MLGDEWVDLGPVTDDPNLNEVVCLCYLGSGIVLAGGSVNLPPGVYTENRIFRSTDYGETWVDLGQIANNANAVYSFYHAGNGRVLAGFGLGKSVGVFDTGGQLYESTDWGETWNLLKVFPGGWFMVRGIAKCAGNIWCVCAIWQALGFPRGYIGRSLDDGATWPGGEQFEIDLPTRDTQGAYDILYLGSNQVLCATKIGNDNGLIYKSNANGANGTWNIVCAAVGIETTTFCFSEGADGVIVAGRDAHIERSTNSGNSWTDMGQVLLVGTEVEDIVYFGSPSNLFLAFGNIGHVIRSTDNGLTWNDLGKKTTAVVEGFTAGVNLENTMVLAGSAMGHIYKSGKIWLLKEPEDLLCEQEKNPTDVTDPTPEFSAVHKYD